MGYMTTKTTIIHSIPSAERVTITDYTDTTTITTILFEDDLTISIVADADGNEVYIYNGRHYSDATFERDQPELMQFVQDALFEL